MEQINRRDSSLDKDCLQKNDDPSLFLTNNVLVSKLPTGRNLHPSLLASE